MEEMQGENTENPYGNGTVWPDISRLPAPDRKRRMPARWGSRQNCCKGKRRDKKGRARLRQDAGGLYTALLRRFPPYDRKAPADGITGSLKSW